VEGRKPPQAVPFLPSGIIIVPAAGGAIVRATDDHAMNQAPEWSPSGDRLFFISNRDGPLDVYEMAVAPSGKLRGSAVRVTTGLNARSLSITDDGGRVAYSLYSGHANIYSVPIPANDVTSSTDATPITSGPQTIEWLSASYDDKWVTYDSDRDGFANLYRIPASGGEPEQLTNETFDLFAPDLSPDGELLAYHSFRSGTRDIEVKPLEGGPIEFVTNTPAQESGPTWAPDGVRILYFDQAGQGGVYVTSRLGAGKLAAPRRVSYGDALLRDSPTFSNWSPDGKWIVTETKSAIVVVAADSGPPRVVYAAGVGEPGPETPLWSRDGRSIYFKSHDRAGRAKISVVSASGGAPRPLVRFPDLSRPSSGTGFGRSASRFYFPIEDRQSNVWIADVAR